MGNDNGKKPVDWRAIRIEYETGQLSVVTICKTYGVSQTQLYRQREKHGWKRDLQREVNDRVQEKLILGLENGGKDFRDMLSEDELQNAQEIAASRAVLVIREHRSGIRTARALADKMIDELTRLSDGDIRDQLLEFVMLGEAGDGETDEEGSARAAKRRQKLAQIIDKALSLPNRAGTLRDLSMVFRNLIPMERQAFNLDHQPDGNSYEEILRQALNGGTDEEPDMIERLVDDRKSLAPAAPAVAAAAPTARVMARSPGAQSGGTHIPVPKSGAKP